MVVDGGGDDWEHERLAEAGAVAADGAAAAAAAPAQPPGVETVTVLDIPERIFTHPGPHDPRWCRRSGAVKPPRAHYCSTCDRLVLKMDHRA
jgi:hypothetical protein